MKKKSSYSFYNSLGEYGGYLFLKRLHTLFPLRFMMRKADILGKIAFYGIRVRRNVLLANLRYAFGKEYHGVQIEIIARGVYAHLIRTALELFNLNKIIGHRGKYIRIVNLEGFINALREGRGAILVTGHFGNFELGALSLAQAGIPISLVVKPLRNPHINKEITRLRQGLDAEIIMVHDAGRKILSALRKNRVVCLLDDQDVGLERGTLVDFFGHPTSTPTGPARIALQTGAPLIPCFIYRTKEYINILEVGHPIKMHYARERRQEEIKRVTQVISSEIEGWIRRFPEQYFWLHRRWKSTQEGKRLYNINI